MLKSPFFLKQLKFVSFVEFAVSLSRFGCGQHCFLAYSL